TTLLQSPIPRVDDPGRGVQAPGMAAMVSSLPPVVENTMNPAAAAHQKIAEPLGEEDAGKDVHLSRNIRESLVKTGLEEFVASQGDVKQGPALDAKSKPHAKEQLNITGIMNTNVNAVLPPLSKEQSMAGPAGAILEQVAAQLPHAINKGSGRIRMSLAPDSMGKLDMDLVVRESRVQIILTAESRTVQQILQGHVEQLKDALQQQGLEVDGFNVLLQNGRQGQGDTAGGGNPFGSEYNRAATDKQDAGNDNFLTTTPFVPGQNLKKGAEGINIFV
ncbi:MAG: flagellar hook-length control protein FliK, partial [Syntrophales bacterium]